MLNAGDGPTVGGETVRWKVLGLIAFAIVIAMFTLLNSTHVVVDFFFVKASVNLVLVILLSMFLGMILMAFFWSLRAWRVRGTVTALQRQVDQLQEEVAQRDQRLVDAWSVVGHGAGDGSGVQTDTGVRDAAEGSGQVSSSD